MNKIQALKHMYKHNTVVRRTVGKLILFKAGMNACDMAKACKIALGNVYAFRRKYKLKFTSRLKENSRETFMERAKKFYVPLWDKRLTVRANAYKIGISYSTAASINQAFGLNDDICTRINEASIKKAKRIKQLQATGLNDAEIARVLGITRERVRQISVMKDF